MDLVKKILKHFRKTILSSFREEQLSQYFTNIISNNFSSDTLKILDFGAGYNPEVIYRLESKLRNLEFDIEITCVDFYSDADINKLNIKSENISFVKFEEIEISEENYDLVIISDVLHHIGIKNLEYDKNLMNVLNIKSILLKDHFEYSIFTRYLIIFMDFIGNYKDSVSIPNQYFNKKSYEQFLEKYNLKVVDKEENIKLYSMFYFPFNLKKIQFIHLLNSSN